MTLLAFDIGGTKSTVILGDANGTVLERREFPSLAERGPDAMIDDLCTNADTLGGEPAAIGVSIGGPMDANNGIIHEPPNLPGWQAIPLRQILADRFGLPTRIDHDAAACALAEYYWGDSQGVARLAYLTCGTGFGVGIIEGGTPLYGADGRSIEIGHIRYRDDGPTAFGKQGCYEAWCAGSSLPKLAACLYPQRWAENPPASVQLSDLWKNHDEDAAALFRQHAWAVGSACALLGDLLVPDCILLGSMARYLGSQWVSWVDDRFRQEVLPTVAAHCKIAPASLDDQLQDLSALAIARRAAEK